MTVEPRTDVEVVVAIVDRADQIGSLISVVPTSWSVRRYPDLAAVPAADLIVLGAATPGVVASARHLLPTARIVAVIDAKAPVELLVDVLQTGADACVRAGAQAQSG